MKNIVEWETFKGFCFTEEGKPPQTLLFSATMPAWVFKTAKKYMKHDALKLDLIGKEGVQTATNVQVGHKIKLWINS